LLSCRLSWAAALYDWLRVTDDRVLVVLKRSDMQRLADAPSQAAARAMYDFVVLSYDLLKDVASLLEGLAFQVVVLDESHCIKNPKVRQLADDEACCCGCLLVTAGEMLDESHCIKNPKVRRQAEGRVNGWRLQGGVCSAVTDCLC
jgi:hypothetical protein